nr:hypothetical protein [Tanacetum cinerariifolium]
MAKIKANRTSRNRDDSHDSRTGSRRRQVSTICEYTYTDFLKCQPLNFKVTEGVVVLTQWFKKMEYFFHISNYIVGCQIKFATFTLQGNSLMWWNSHVKTVGHDAAYAMTWKNLKKMMTDKYCSRGKIKKLKIELWNMKVKGSVVASKPKKMQDEIEFVIELMDQKICTLAERQVENKRKFKDTSKNNQNQQQPLKRHNVARAYTAGPRDKKLYGGSKPLCPKCNYHHDGKCAPKSFVSTAFSSLIDIIPTTLDHGYNVELVNGRIICVNTLTQGCTLNLLNHPFDIDLMPVEMGSFNVIIRMDRFIEGFLKIAKSMTKLTQKKVKFDWGDKQETTFELLKEKWGSAPILALSKGAENFIVYCDASHKGLGAVLMQNQKEIAYAS